MGYESQSRAVLLFQLKYEQSNPFAGSFFWATRPGAVFVPPDISGATSNGQSF